MSIELLYLFHDFLQMLADDEINIIASYLEDKDYMSMRNTCKRFREIDYKPKRLIATGVKLKRKLELRGNRCIFVALSILIGNGSVVLTTIALILFSLDKITAISTITYSTMITFGIILCILDIVFITLSFKITKHQELVYEKV